MASRRQKQRYFHGGVPRLQPLSPILSAVTLGHVYSYGRRTLTPGSVPYDPSLVYLTTDLSAATGFAARYVDPSTGATGGGWAYEVDPSSSPARTQIFPSTPKFS